MTNGQKAAKRQEIERLLCFSFGYDVFVQKLFKSEIRGDNSDECHFIHAAIGMAGEAGELLAAIYNEDKKNIIEEAGDFVFYVQAALNKISDEMKIKCIFEISLLSDREFEKLIYSNCKEIVPDHLKQDDAIVSATLLSIVACDMLDVCKKSWIYGKPIDYIKMMSHIISSLSLLENICVKYYCDMSRVVAGNIVKLNARYPTGQYSDAYARDRLDKIARGID